MAEQYSILQMYCIFFIHSSVNNQLDCFHVWAIVNSASVNTGVHVFFCIMFFSGFMPSSVIPESQDIDGWDRRKERGYICVSIADSLHCIAETSTTRNL